MVCIMCCFFFIKLYSLTMKSSVQVNMDLYYENIYRIEIDVDIICYNRKHLTRADSFSVNAVKIVYFPSPYEIPLYFISWLAK